MAKNLAKHWWAFLVRGIVAIVFAILLLTATGFTLQVLIILLGLYLVLDGLFAIIASLMTSPEHKNTWLLTVEGIVSILAGIFVLALPGTTLVILVYLVAIWAVVTGIFEIIAAFISSWAIPGKSFVGIAGLISILLGLIILLYPLISLIAMIWLVAIYDLVIAITLIILGIKLKAGSPE